MMVQAPKLWLSLVMYPIHRGVMNPRLLPVNVLEIPNMVPAQFGAKSPGDPNVQQRMVH